MVCGRNNRACRELLHRRWEKYDPEEPEDHHLGRSRGGVSTKVHLLCDGHGHPLDFHLTAGQEHESTALQTLLEQADQDLVDQNGEPIDWPVHLVGDKAYRADWTDEYLLEIGIQPVMPSKDSELRNVRPIEFDRAVYKRRSIIENLIGWLKESRRILTRFEKTAKNFAGMITLAFVRRYLRLMCKPHSETTPRIPAET